MPLRRNFGIGGRSLICWRVIFCALAFCGDPCDLPSAAEFRLLDVEPDGTLVGLLELDVLVDVVVDVPVLLLHAVEVQVLMVEVFELADVTRTVVLGAAQISSPLAVLVVLAIVAGSSRKDKVSCCSSCHGNMTVSSNVNWLLSVVGAAAPASIRPSDVSSAPVPGSESVRGGAGEWAGVGQGITNGDVGTDEEGIRLITAPGLKKSVTLFVPPLAPLLPLLPPAKLPLQPPFDCNCCCC